MKRITWLNQPSVCDYKAEFFQLCLKIELGQGTVARDRDGKVVRKGQPVAFFKNYLYIFGCAGSLWL